MVKVTGSEGAAKPSVSEQDAEAGLWGGVITEDAVTSSDKKPFAKFKNFFTNSDFAQKFKSLWSGPRAALPDTEMHIHRHINGDKQAIAGFFDRFKGHIGEK